MSPTPCPKDAAPLTEKANLLGPGHSGLVCPKCAGVQVPWSEAQKFFERLGLSLADLQSAVKQARPRPGQQTPPECTACHAGPMKPFTVKGVELDLCEACGSTWFDRGELQRISKGKLGQELAQAPVAAPDERVETVGVFQMFWDCAFCGTTALLGQKHLCCPSCGAQQDAARRYFPPPGQEVAANTQFDGADRLCPACQTPNGAAAKFCRSCGSPLEGSQEAARVADRVAQPPRPTTPQSKRTPVWVWVIGVLLVLSCVTCGVAMTWTRSSTATVTGHTWKREVDVEQLAAASDSAWCDSVPSGAYDVSRHREQRSTKKVADGEECGTRDVDRGNGTFERRRECHPKYREEPVYDERCSYRVDRWQHERSVNASGRDRSPQPEWPRVSLGRTGSCLGCEREGSRRETYTLELKGPKGERWSCDVARARWDALDEGMARPVQVGVMTNSPHCDSL